MLILEYVLDEMKNLRSFWKLWIPLCIRYYVRLNIYIISSQYAWIQKFLTFKIQQFLPNGEDNFVQYLQKNWRM